MRVWAWLFVGAAAVAALAYIGRKRITKFVGALDPQSAAFNQMTESTAYQTALAGLGVNLRTTGPTGSEIATSREAALAACVGRLTQPKMTVSARGELVNTPSRWSRPEALQECSRRLDAAVRRVG